MTDQVLITTIDSRGVARLTMNRPDIRNAFNEQLVGDICETMGRLNADANVRAIVMTGAGKAFSAGADLNIVANAQAPQLMLFLPTLRATHETEAIGSQHTVTVDSTTLAQLHTVVNDHLRVQVGTSTDNTVCSDINPRFKDHASLNHGAGFYDHMRPHERICRNARSVGYYRGGMTTG